MIAIIDYKAGNAPSVLHAVNRLGLNAMLAHTADDLIDKTHIVLPGVGSAKATMLSLEEMGLLDVLEDAVHNRRVYFLGICVGMQVLFERSEEENAVCLGWLKGDVARYDSSKVRVPQMGWNEVKFQWDAGFKAQDDYFYFVNSYYAKSVDADDVWGVTDYNGAFAAAVNKDNMYGMQFHVEKSGEAGLSLLKSVLTNRKE